MAFHTAYEDAKNPLFPSVKEGENMVRVLWDGGRKFMMNGSILYRPTPECKEWDGVTAGFAVGNRHGSYSYVDITITGRTVQRIPKTGSAYGVRCQVQFYNWNPDAGTYEKGDKIVGYVLRHDYDVIKAIPE